MGDFGLFFIEEEIQSVFDEVDLYLESEEMLRFLFEENDDLDWGTETTRNRRLNKDRHLDPKTDSSWRAADRWRQLQAVTTHETEVNGTPRNQIWISFSEVSKLGQRYKISGGKSTPVGIFAFPIDFALKQKSNLPFSSRAYLHVFKTHKRHLEAGGSDMDPNFQKTKDKLPKHLKGNTSTTDDPKVMEFKTAVYQVYEKFSDKLYQWTPEGAKDADQASEYQDSVRQWANNLYYSLRGGIDGQYYGTMPEKMAKLEQDYPWLVNPHEALEEFGGNPETVKEKLKEYIQSLSEEVYEDGSGYKYVTKYTNVQDDMSANLGPDYAKHIAANEPSYNHYPKLVQAAKSGGRLALDDITSLDSYPFDSYSAGGKLLKQLKNSALFAMPSFQQMSEEVLQQFSAVVKQFAQQQPTGEGEPEQDGSNMPHGKKLKAYAAEKGLDFAQAVKFAVSESPKTVYNPSQFLYRAAQSFAQQMANRGEGDWRMKWNSVLRDLGVSSVADTKNSGHVHSAEPTQGVFMDPKDIVPISVIIQKSHASGNDPASRPDLKGGYYSSGGWDGSEGSHSRTKDPTDQRKGPNPIGNEVKDLRGPDRFHYGLSKRVASVSANIPTYGGFTSSNSVEIDHALTQLIKLAKAHNRLQSSGYKPGKNYGYATLFDGNMRAALRRLESMVQRTENPDEQIKQKVDILAQLSTGRRVDTPMYKKRDEDEDEDEDEDDDDPDDEEDSKAKLLKKLNAAMAKGNADADAEDDKPWHSKLPPPPDDITIVP